MGQSCYDRLLFAINQALPLPYERTQPGHAGEDCQPIRDDGSRSGDRLNRLRHYDCDQYPDCNANDQERGIGEAIRRRAPAGHEDVRYLCQFGPYPIVGATIAAGINQADDAPPEWKQGAAGYSKRFGSAFGIAVVSTTTRFALAKAFRQDALYYRCQCKGVFPRLSHAVISTFTARRGDDGHRVFSLPALVAPYAGTMTAVYGWYPGRYGAKDAFRMGNYSMLGYIGGNIALEFFHSGPHSLFSRMHLNNGHGAPASGSQP